MALERKGTAANLSNLTPNNIRTSLCVLYKAAATAKK